MKIYKLDFEGSLITNEDSKVFSLVKVYKDYSFDKRGVLQIQTYTYNDGISSFHSFIIPRIYDFVKCNSTYKSSMGKVELYNDIIEEFEHFNSNNFEQIMTLLEISESLDNCFITDKISKEQFYLKQ